MFARKSRVRSLAIVSFSPVSTLSLFRTHHLSRPTLSILQHPPNPALMLPLLPQRIIYPAETVARSICSEDQIVIYPSRRASCALYHLVMEIDQAEASCFVAF